MRDLTHKIQHQVQLEFYMFLEQVSLLLNQVLSSYQKKINEYHEN